MINRIKEWFAVRKRLALTPQRRGHGEIMLRGKVQWGHQGLTGGALLIAVLYGLSAMLWSPFVLVFAFFMEGLDAFVNSVVNLFLPGKFKRRMFNMYEDFKYWFSWWDVYDYSLPVLPVLGSLFGPWGTTAGLVADFVVWFVLLPLESKGDG